MPSGTTCINGKNVLVNSSAMSITNNQMTDSGTLRINIILLPVTILTSLYIRRAIKLLF